METRKKKTTLLLALMICLFPGISSCANTPVEQIAEVRSGIAQIISPISSTSIRFLGSAFLVEGGIVTNSHVLSNVGPKGIAIRFADTDPNDRASYIRFNHAELQKVITRQSPRSAKDYAYLEFNHPLLKNRHVFQFTDTSNLSVGEQVVFLGFPGRTLNMTAHIGYVSAMYSRNNVEIIQIDGSVNGGNSGGPLLDLKTGKVAGIITQTDVGFIVGEFNKLIKTLQQNQKLFEKREGMMDFGGVDPMKAFKDTHAAMEQIAKNLKQSANVGIGYAYSSNYVRDDIIKIRVVPK